jgi:hypothetical protein
MRKPIGKRANSGVEETKRENSVIRKQYCNASSRGSMGGSAGIGGE